jgi:DNA-directed RNA polymerase subunit RPC12/RpoP
MPIQFHCEHCGKKIEAPDNAGGKWGKCPRCHNKVYVPQPDAGDDELKLAPIDEGEALRQRQLMAETFEITQNILEEKTIPEVPTSGQNSDMSDERLTEIVIRYLRQMYEGDLEDAQRTSELIITHRRRVPGVLNQIATSDPPDPELMDIPQQVLSGLIRSLRTQIS